MVKRAMIGLVLGLMLVSAVMAQDDGTSYDGVWANFDEGAVMEVENGTGTLYSIQGCTPFYDVKIEGDTFTLSGADSTEVFTTTVENDEIIALIEGEPIVAFVRVESLESVCVPLATVSAADLTLWVERALPTEFPAIERHPDPADYTILALRRVANYDPASSERMDWRSADISALDLSDKLDALLHADFDDRTIWPDQLPPEFDWQQIMTLGKNPGLGIRTLHAQGITGQGVGIAILDQPLLVDHEEYAGQLRFYEETPEISVKQGWSGASMHGPAVASIAVGQTVGVAPGADLYFIGSALGGERTIDFTFLAASIRRILKINDELPADRKIRVISMSIGWQEGSLGHEEFLAAIEEAKAAGMLVVSSDMAAVHGFYFNGLGRDPLGDPDLPASYGPGLWWAADYFATKGEGAWYADRLMFPMDSRTLASPTGTDEYVFYAEGGWSWSIPYIAGLYALAVQVDPALTPDQFWALAMETGDTIELDHEGEIIPFGPIVNPVALIEALQSGQ